MDYNDPPGNWVYTHDMDGNLTEKTNGTGVGNEKWQYSWDCDDRLVQVSKGVYASGAVLVNEFTVQYSYDSMGRMLRRDNGTDVTTFVWDGWDLLSETTGSVTTTYLVPDGLVWSFSRGEDVFQVHTDALGSVRVVTDSDGDVVARFEFGSWGELLPGSFDSVGLALRFVGALGVRTDLETGLLWMRHRWYDPTLQRFISRDPIGLEGGANLYAYPLNPSTMIDETGLKQSFTLEMPGKLLLEAGAAIGNQLVKAGSAVLSAARVATPVAAAVGATSWGMANTNVRMPGDSMGGDRFDRMRSHQYDENDPGPESPRPELVGPNQNPPRPARTRPQIDQEFKAPKPNPGDNTRPRQPSTKPPLKRRPDYPARCHLKRKICEVRAVRDKSCSEEETIAKLKQCEIWFKQCEKNYGPFMP